MNPDWQKDLQIRRPGTAAFLPPPLMAETGWDILLALHSDERGELALDKLASIVSVPRNVVNRWLTTLAHRNFVAPKRPPFSGELRAILTSDGRYLLDNYLSATTGLQSGARH